MEWIRFITQGFDYDRWANRQWLGAIGGFKNIERAHEVLEHILSSQMTWLSRCGVELEPQVDNTSLQELFDQTATVWIALMEQTDPGEIIAYSTSTGREFAQPLAEIALHVINHGTYHRGQLRGLAEADGFNNFPETDLIGFLRHGLGTPFASGQTAN